jgi:hypothetical protein
MSNIKTYYDHEFSNENQDATTIYDNSTPTKDPPMTTAEILSKIKQRVAYAKRTGKTDEAHLLLAQPDAETIASMDILEPKLLERGFSIKRKCGCILINW